MLLDAALYTPKRTKKTAAPKKPTMSHRRPVGIALRTCANKQPTVLPPEDPMQLSNVEEDPSNASYKPENTNNAKEYHDEPNLEDKDVEDELVTD